VEFAPGELVQGGAVVVYFNEPATAATMTFGGKQYPMLFDGARWWAMIGVGAFSEPGVAPIAIAYNPADGSPQTTVESSIAIVDREFPVENIELDDSTSSLLDPAIVNNEEALRATIFSGYTTQRLWDGFFQAPGAGAISSSYGIARSYNSGPVTSYHRGTDFIGAEGDPVYAAAAGRVVFAEALQVRGNAVIVDHGVGVFTTYNHLSAINVAEGEMVSAGQLIGQIGATGLVTGPHLHWEVVVRGVEVDGELWLSGNVGP
jgi:murein DD-endopeptidase MepM/ murein hydrolase activator NlpD